MGWKIKGGAAAVAPFRLRSKKYLDNIRGQDCLYPGCFMPGSAHHLTHAQPRAMGLKTGDQYCVPLCHKHHMELHESHMSEADWWDMLDIDPIKWAEEEYNGYLERSRKQD